MTGIIQRCALFCLLLLAAFPRPSGAEEDYTVRKGDNLSRIARWHGVTAESLVEANGLASDRLMPGMKLRIPPRQGESESAAAAPILVYKPAESKPEETATAPPAMVVPESRLTREIKELTESPLVKEVKELSEPFAGTDGIKEKLTRIAKKMLDIPYRFGGSSFRGIDCSGYVQKVFSLLNIVLPRTAREQFNRGALVDKDDLSIGDLVFFRTYAKFPSHVGIYLGDNRFIHASSKDRRVKIDSMDAPYYIKRFVGARRLPLDKEPAGEI